MKIKQVSVFLENKSGRLAAVTKTLADNGINIRALSIADTSDFGILRLIVSEPDRAYRVLKGEGFTVSIAEVIGVAMPDNPGGLADVLAILEQRGVDIEYLYAFVGSACPDALVICRVEKIDDAIEVLQEKGINILSGETVYSL